MLTSSGHPGACLKALLGWLQSLLGSLEAILGCRGVFLGRRGIILGHRGGLGSLHGPYSKPDGAFWKRRRMLGNCLAAQDSKEGNGDARRHMLWEGGSF